MQSMAEKMQKSGLTQRQIEGLPEEFDWMYRNFLGRTASGGDSTVNRYKKEWERMYDAITNKGHIVRLRDKDDVEASWRYFRANFPPLSMASFDRLRKHEDLLDAERRAKLEEFYKDLDDARLIYAKLLPLVEAEYLKHNEAKFADLDAEEDGSAVFSPENYTGHGMHGSGQGSSRAAAPVARTLHDDLKDEIQLEMNTVRLEFVRLVGNDLPEAIVAYRQYAENLRLLGTRGQDAFRDFMIEYRRLNSKTSGLTELEVGDFQVIAMDTINRLDDLRTRMEVFKRRGEAEKGLPERYIDPRIHPRYAAGAGMPKRARGRGFVVS